jgi:hypothetical protein
MTTESHHKMLPLSIIHTSRQIISRNPFFINNIALVTAKSTQLQIPVHNALLQQNKPLRLDAFGNRLAGML